MRCRYLAIDVSNDNKKEKKNGDKENQKEQG
jgi:hypothetical protein